MANWGGDDEDMDGERMRILGEPNSADDGIKEKAGGGGNG